MIYQMAQVPSAFENAIRVLARIPPLANFLCLCDWEKYAYRRAKRAFSFAKSVHTAILGIVVDGNCSFESAWTAFVSASKPFNAASVATVTVALSNILALIQRVIVIKDAPRMITRCSTVPPKTANDIVTEIFGGYVDAKWKQVFTHDDTHGGGHDWSVYPRVLRLMVHGNASDDMGRMLSIDSTIYMPIVFISEDGSVRGEHTGADSTAVPVCEVIYGIMPQSPFAM